LEQARIGRVLAHEQHDGSPTPGAAPFLATPPDAGPTVTVVPPLDTGSHIQPHRQDVQAAFAHAPMDATAASRRRAAIVGKVRGQHGCGRRGSGVNSGGSASVARNPKGSSDAA
jgi:hypothetical protein